MRSVVFAVIAVLGLFVAAFSQAAPRHVAAAYDATPAGSPVAGLPPGVEELCSEHQLAQGELVFRAPPGKSSGSVLPFDMDTHRLFLTVMTLPPGACVGWREREGPVILLVQEGIIDFTAHYSGDAEVLTGDSDDPDCVWGSPGCATASVDSDETIALHGNDWVTQDRTMWYTFRNGGAEDATVSVASYVIPWDEEDPCGGSCRAP